MFAISDFIFAEILDIDREGCVCSNEMRLKSLMIKVLEHIIVCGYGSGGFFR